MLQEKIQKKAEGFGKLAPAFLEGAKFALNNQWISVDEDLPCNNPINIHFGFTIDILSPLKEVRFLDTNVAATPS